MAADKSPWDRASWLDIGRVLLSADGRTLTAPEIAAARGASSSSATTREAEAMVEEGLLERRPPPKRQPGTRGRAVRHAYFLASSSAAAVRDRVGEPEPVGVIRDGIQLVFADAGSEQIASLLEALAGGDALGRASWFALCDGEPQQLVIAFTGDEAIEAAADLMAELRGAELRAQRANVTEVQVIDRLAQRARRTARAARKARMARATREAS